METMANEAKNACLKSMSTLVVKSNSLFYLGAVLSK